MHGIVLDDLLSTAFRTGAYHEGFAFFPKSERDFGTAEVIHNLKNSRNEKWKELIRESYASMVLFDKLYIKAFHVTRGDLADTSYDHTLRFDTLIQDGAVELAEYSDTNQLGFTGTVRPSELIEFRDMLIEIAMSQSRLRGFGEISRKTYMEALEKLGTFADRKSWLAEHGVETNNSDFIGEFAYTGRYHSALTLAVEQLLFGYHAIRYLMRTMEFTGCPGRTNLHCLLEQRHLNAPEGAFRAYQILLEEKCTFPYPRSLRSALALRRDSRVKDFRDVLFRWAGALSDGDPLQEQRFRREIIKAKKDLERVSSYRRIGRLLTFVSLPVSIAATIIGVPFGLIVLPIGPLITLDSKRLERRANWLMFGSNC